MATVLEIAEEVSGLSSSDADELRFAAQNNLYVLAKGILGYKDVDVAAHGAFCRFIQSSPKLRRLGLMARGHLKSTLGTVTDSVRLALKDPEDTRILIAGETSTLAEKFLSEIKKHFENNIVLRSLFPELIPERFSGPGVQWSSTMASVTRSSPWKEPTWQAIGVGGASVGSHFTRIKCDDLIGFEAIRSAATMAYTKAWVDNIEPLLTNQQTDIIDFIGTRWSRNDLYGHVMEGYGDALGVYTRGAVENGQIVFPALHTWEEYRRIQRINPAQWFAQYENNPISTVNADFPIDAVRSFRFTHDGKAVVTDRNKRWDLEQLDVVIAVDPNSGSLVAPDAAAIIVIGMSPDGEVFVLEAWSGRPSPSGLVDEVFRKAQRWRPRVVGIEKAGQQNTHHYFERKAQDEHFNVRVEELNPRGRAKPDRVRGALEPVIRSGLLHILPSQTTLRQQIAEFPDCILWDEVDALAYGPELWRKPVKKEEVEKSEGIIKKILSLRNPVTGY